MAETVALDTKQSELYREKADHLAARLHDVERELEAARERLRQTLAEAALGESVSEALLAEARLEVERLETALVTLRAGSEVAGERAEQAASAELQAAREALEADLSKQLRQDLGDLLKAARLRVQADTLTEQVRQRVHDARRRQGELDLPRTYGSSWPNPTRLPERVRELVATFGWFRSTPNDPPRPPALTKPEDLEVAIAALDTPLREVTQHDAH